MRAAPPETPCVRAEEAVLAPEFRRTTEEVLARMGVSGRLYTVGLLLSAGLTALGAAAWGWQLWSGLGVTGLQHPVMWATYIASFIWWIGIAHSGTMVSAILYLFRAPFRSAFSRAAEAMTLIAIVTAAMFPILHLGRAWRAYWLFPYPNERDLWVTFRSPLILDVFAVLAYLIVSALFFWLGLIPDLAVLRDRAKGWARTWYGLGSLGWEGRGAQWKQYLLAYSLLAGLATPLVISVHSIVSWDFSLTLVPGWHSTLFPPYFVAGAVFSGLAMVLTLVLPMRAALRLERFITERHLDQLARLVLLMSLLVSFSYVLEYWTAWHSPEPMERIDLLEKATGALAPLFWTSLVCNSLAPLALFWPGVRRSVPALFLLSLVINVGMWLERFIVVAGSLMRDYLP
ncbi:MAG TPA: NrfD/PsrC family molybdoenzyme membrane anchor subunit, partial [Armatimonadota bacterium]|nr:NrfD/PsrC family molybdoenzyme membrane anchor subunit [Armatimonadota bacterium]